MFLSGYSVCVVLCIVCVSVCTVMLPPGDNTIAVNRICHIQAILRGMCIAWIGRNM